MTRVITVPLRRHSMKISNIEEVPARKKTTRPQITEFFEI